MTALIETRILIPKLTAMLSHRCADKYLIEENEDGDISIVPNHVFNCFTKSLVIAVSEFADFHEMNFFVHLNNNKPEIIIHS